MLIFFKSHESKQKTNISPLARNPNKSGNAFNYNINRATSAMNVFSRHSNTNMSNKNNHRLRVKQLQFMKSKPIRKSMVNSFVSNSMNTSNMNTSVFERLHTTKIGHQRSHQIYNNNSISSMVNNHQNHILDDRSNVRTPMNEDANDSEEDGILMKNNGMVNDENNSSGINGKAQRIVSEAYSNMLSNPIRLPL